MLSQANERRVSTRDPAFVGRTRTPGSAGEPSLPGDTCVGSELLTRRVRHPLEFLLHDLRLVSQAFGIAERLLHPVPPLFNPGSCARS